MRRRHQSGAVAVEMALVGIPIIFVLISIFEMSRGMWMYHTLAHAVRNGVRLASVHGVNCVFNPPGVPNNCSLSPNQIMLGATIGTVKLPGIKDAAVGIEPVVTTLTFVSANGSFTCPLPHDLTDQAGGNCNQAWPPAASNANNVGQTIEIDIKTPFRSALAMFWPGSKPVAFAVVNLSAASSDTVQF